MRSAIINSQVAAQNSSYEESACDMHHFLFLHKTDSGPQHRDPSKSGGYVMSIKKCIGLNLICSLVVLIVVSLHSAAWAECTVQERTELGKQGYDMGEVDEVCAGDKFLETLGTSTTRDLASGLVGMASRERNPMDPKASAPTASGSNVCVTNAGACPLSGVPIGLPCYCQTWSANKIIGVSK